MKKILLFMACVCMMSVVRASSDNDRPITVGQLPDKAQAFIKQHFADVQVALAKVEDDFFDKEYKVIFVTGQKIEFDRRGDWMEIDCKYSEVPSSVLPAFVSQHVNKTWPDAKVWKIEKDNKDREYEVKLSNRWELTFNFKGVLTDAESD